MGWFNFLISSNFMYAFRDTSTYVFPSKVASQWIHILIKSIYVYHVKYYVPLSKFNMYFNHSQYLYSSKSSTYLHWNSMYISMKSITCVFLSKVNMYFQTLLLLRNISKQCCSTWKHTYWNNLLYEATNSTIQKDL